MSDREPFRIVEITVKPDRIVCDLDIDPKNAYTTPKIAKAFCRLFPDLPLHTCVNDEGKTFGDVMANTSFAHLFEHIVIDIQASSAKASEKVFVGTSEWIDEFAGRARVTVNFTDDMDALRAFRQASRIINDAVLECKNG